MNTVIPYNKSSVIAEIRKYGQLISEEFEPEGTSVKAYIPKQLADKYDLTK